MGRTNRHIYRRTGARDVGTQAARGNGVSRCLGILTLVKQYSAERLEAACRRALLIGSPTRRSVASILREGLDRLPIGVTTLPPEISDRHQNIRGAEYYK